MFGQVRKWLATWVVTHKQKGELNGGLLAGYNLGYRQLTFLAS